MSSRRWLLVTSSGIALILTVIGICSYWAQARPGNVSTLLTRFDSPAFEARDGTIRWYLPFGERRRGPGDRFQSPIPAWPDGRLTAIEIPMRWLPVGYGDVLVEKTWMPTKKRYSLKFESYVVRPCVFVNVWALVLPCALMAWFTSGWKLGAFYFLLNPGDTIAKFRRRRLERLLERGLCLECGYDLRGNESGVCPECGQGVLSSVRG